MEVTDVLLRLDARAAKAAEIIAQLDQQITDIKKAAPSQFAAGEETRLREENALLKAEIEVWKIRLIEAECKNGLKQYLQGFQCVNGQDRTNNQTQTVAVASVKTDNPTEKNTGKEVKKKQDKGTKKDSENKQNKSTKSAAVDDRAADVSRLDFRVGKIISAKKHPDADSLYVEEVDLGEGKNRTVVSGLVKFVPIEQMQNRPVVLLCNLKPAKMRGIVSEAMVMCASTPEKVEILIPPTDSVPGDKVICEEYPGEPDKELNPKKKIFEQVAPDLKTDVEKRATYKGKILKVIGKGNVVAPSLINVQIK